MEARLRAVGGLDRGLGTAGPQLLAKKNGIHLTSLQEAETRLHTADYVEARGILLPAVEYLKQAVDEASSQGNPRGSLLVTVCGIHFTLLSHLTV